MYPAISETRIDFSDGSSVENLQKIHRILLPSEDNQFQ